MLVTLFAGDKSKVQKMVQMAWTFINDRYDHYILYFSLVKVRDVVFWTKVQFILLFNW